MAAAKGAKMYSLCGNVFFCFLICLVGCVKEIAFPFQACVLEELLGFEKEELLQVLSTENAGLDAVVFPISLFVCVKPVASIRFGLDTNGDEQ
ncbi:uncharacterized protein LOC123523174 isoform X6 [Mercenaria mercenaria]|nr:uncharacterized protein LOC123523174 isoform X6 [Mercenaria mercenaria]